MADQPWKQLSPNPGLDPGFRVDPRGRARFLVRGFTVDVDFTHVDEYASELLMTAVITLDGIKVVESSRAADWSEPYIMRGVLDELLADVVNEARFNVNKLAKRVAEIDAKQN